MPKRWHAPHEPQAAEAHDWQDGGAWIPHPARHQPIPTPRAALPPATPHTEADSYQTAALRVVRAVLDAGAHHGEAGYLSEAARHYLDGAIPLDAEKQAELDRLALALGGQEWNGTRTEWQDAPRRAFYAFLYAQSHDHATLQSLANWALYQAREDAYGRYAADKGTETDADKRSGGAGRFSKPGATWASYLLVSFLRLCHLAQVGYDDTPDAGVAATYQQLTERAETERAARRAARTAWRTLADSLTPYVCRAERRDRQRTASADSWRRAGKPDAPRFRKRR